LRIPSSQDVSTTSAKPAWTASLPSPPVPVAARAMSAGVKIERPMQVQTTRASTSCGSPLRSSAVRLAPAIYLALLAAVWLTVAASAPGSRPPPPVPAARPSIVFVLTDDLSWNLVRFMPNVRKMQREGMTFTNYFVTDSLCCPSRASIFTGRYPHNHGVLTNTAPGGGFAAFRDGAESHTFATALQGAGYRTAMMGKYLNGYRPIGRYVPEGWSNWQVPGSGAYGGFGYLLSSNGRTAHFGTRRRDYVTDVLRRRGLAFVDRVARKRVPFFLEVATYAPHAPYTPAPRDRSDFPGLIAPRTAAFDAQTRNAPAWLRDRTALTPEQIARLNENFRKRAQAVQAVDDLIGGIRARLKARGVADNTYIVFSSDNGLHLGEHRLETGKMTAFDTDIRVPLIVVGPDVPRGSVTNALTENIDLAPTFVGIGRGKPAASVDGRSLLGLLHGFAQRPWRDAVLIEHHHPETPNGDPDHQTARGGNPPSYEALRTKDGLYVEYVDGEREWYDLRTDPNELDNRYEQLDYAERFALHEWLAALQACRGEGCRRAAVR
jgi:N-acetylglucosamine-6-sulfatase